MRIILAAALCAGVAAPALAQLPAPLEAALAVTPREAEPVALDFRLEEGGEGVTVRVDLGGEAAAYTLLEPSEADLSEAQQEMWSAFLDPEDDLFRDPGESGPGLTGPADLRPMIGPDARLLREEGGLSIYGFAPQTLSAGPGGGGEDSSMDSMLEHLSGEIAVDRAHGRVAWLHLFAPESFKPNMAARIHDFSMRHRFVHEPAYAAPRLARFELALSGRAAFQTFEQSLAMELSNMVFAPGDAQPAHLGAGAESP